MWMSFGGLIMCTLLVLLHLSYFTEVEVPSENICVCVICSPSKLKGVKVLNQPPPPTAFS